MKVATRGKPLLIFDGDCGFCRRKVTRWQVLTGSQVEYAPFQEVEPQFPGISREQFQSSVQLIDTDGSVYGGAEAVLRLMSHVPQGKWLLWVYRRVPGFSPLAEWGYRFVARHRSTKWCLTPKWPNFLKVSGKKCQTPSYRVATWIFLRGVGIVYLIAFASLWSQMDGLVGQNGILPVKPFLEAAQGELGPSRFWWLPTLCWLNPSDGFLHLLCGGGVLFSSLLIFGIAPGPVLFLLWGFYLSLLTICREFLSFQWDILLLEAGFLSIFLAPLGFKPKPIGQMQPSVIVLWLLKWLLFRLIFSSGIVKLSSGDLAWRSLTALSFHYETQPLPTWTSWVIHQAPLWFQKASTFGMFVIELAIPFLIFAPRRWRLFACGAIIALQLLIMATGNYCFFNLLTILLCLLLIDDFSWQKIWRWLPQPSPSTSPSPLRGEGRDEGWSRWILFPLTGVILLVSSVQLVSAFRVPVPWPRPVMELVQGVAPFHSVNRYGLFAVMTTSRPEIIVEGSLDGMVWKPYEFKYKPGDPRPVPRFVAPHQPRLDWQMWFAALGSYQENPWFISFCLKLLEGSPQVLALLKENPFQEAPPRYLRAVLYDYRFTNPLERRSTGDWWKRKRLGLYCPVLSLREEKIRPEG